MPNGLQNGLRNLIKSDEQRHLNKIDKTCQTCRKRRSRTFEKRVSEWRSYRIPLKPLARASANKCQKKTTDNPNPWKTKPRDQQNPILKSITQTASGHQKWVRSALEVFPTIKKLSKHDTKEPPDSEKELQKSSIFRAWFGGLREALAITQQHIMTKRRTHRKHGRNNWRHPRLNYCRRFSWCMYMRNAQQILSPAEDRAVFPMLQQIRKSVKCGRIRARCHPPNGRPSSKLHMHICVCVQSS